MKRPSFLPEFENPPLDEVILGIQFDPISGFNSFAAYQIWEHLKNELPRIEEQPLLTPQFETFGGNPTQNGLKLQFGSGQPSSRFWFISQDENHLVQLQHDRILLNWRKRSEDDSYPRFENIRDIFSKNISDISNVIQENYDQILQINQAEVTYINLVDVDDFNNIGEWISTWRSPDFDIEVINMFFAEAIKDKDSRSFARMHHEINSVFSQDGSTKAFRIGLTFRGKPVGKNVDDAIDFITEGREKIVNRFTELTTEKAHKDWKRLK